VRNTLIRHTLIKVIFSLFSLDDSSAQAVASSSYKTVDSAIFDRAELERDPTLKQIQAWSFPIFHFAEKHKRTVLTRVRITIKFQILILERVKIPSIRTLLKIL
jgi:hypothetical protein